MNYKKVKLAIRIVVATMVLTSTTTMLLSSDTTGVNLSPDQIFKQTRKNYALLTSYSDQGQVTSQVNGTTMTTLFTIQLSRPTFYSIEWHLENNLSQVTPYNSVQAVWSSGAGDFLETGYGPQYENSLNVALDEAAPSSGGVSANIPTMFFDIESGNELKRSVYDESQQQDDNVGSVDCYVFKRESQGLTRTLWIGKKDFLVHQVRTVISAEAMRATMAKLTQERPQSIAFLQDFTSTETHTNIVVNKRYSRSDFIPSVAHFASSYNEDD
jgi:outer membrane lipoprotein-sorting protein